MNNKIYLFILNRNCISSISMLQTIVRIILYFFTSNFDNRNNTNNFGVFDPITSMKRSKYLPLLEQYCFTVETASCFSGVSQFNVQNQRYWNFKITIREIFVCTEARRWQLMIIRSSCVRTNGSRVNSRETCQTKR